MYLTRKARAKQQRRTTSDEVAAPRGGGDDEMLVANAEQVCNLPDYVPLSRDGILMGSSLYMINAM